MSNTVRTRAAAQNALDAYAASEGISEANADEPETLIPDLIADLMHLADSLGHSGEDLAGLATDFYADDLAESLVRD